MKNTTPPPPHKVGDIVGGGREVVTAVYWQAPGWNGLTQSWDTGRWVVETQPNPEWLPLPAETIEGIARALDWSAVGHLAEGCFPLRLKLNLSQSEKDALLPHLIEAVKRVQPEMWRRKVVQHQFEVRCAEVHAERKAALDRELARVAPQIAAIEANPDNWQTISVDERLTDEDGYAYGSAYRTTRRILTPEARAKVEEIRAAAEKAAGWVEYAEIYAEVKAGLSPEERACL